MVFITAGMGGPGTGAAPIPKISNGDGYFDCWNCNNAVCF